MGLCKCPKRKVTNLFCFEHKVNVCENCLVTDHVKCVVRSYLQWLQDSDFEPFCCICQDSLEAGDVVRLMCYDVLHSTCAEKFLLAYPAHTAPDGFFCPACHAPFIPQDNVVSPVADALRRSLDGMTALQKRLHSLSASSPVLKSEPPSSLRPDPEGTEVPDEAIVSWVERTEARPDDIRCEKDYDGQTKESENVTKGGGGETTAAVATATTNTAATNANAVTDTVPTNLSSVINMASKHSTDDLSMSTSSSASDFIATNFSHRVTSDRTSPDVTSPDVTLNLDDYQVTSPDLSLNLTDIPDHHADHHADRHADATLPLHVMSRDMTLKSSEQELSHMSIEILDDDEGEKKRVSPSFYKSDEFRQNPSLTATSAEFRSFDQSSAHAVHGDHIASGYAPASHGMNSPAPTSHGMNPLAPASHGINPLVPASHGMNPLAPASHGMNPLAPASHGMNPPVPASHGMNPLAPTSHDAYASVTFAPSSLSDAPNSHGFAQSFSSTPPPMDIPFSEPSPGPNPRTTSSSAIRSSHHHGNNIMSPAFHHHVGRGHGAGHVTGQVTREDHDDHKYRRKPLMEMVKTWLRIFSSPRGRRPPASLCRRFLVVLLIGVVSLFALVLLFHHLGRSGRPDDDPLLDLKANPFVKVNEE